jgi:hypothetical protein
MSDPAVHRTLIVANRTTATPKLVEEVRRRAHEQATEFALLIPASDQEDDWTPEYALPVLEKAARGTVESIDGTDDPFDSVQAAVADGNFQDIILSTPHHRFAGLLHRDLAHRCEQLGVPVMVLDPHPDHLPVPNTTELAGPLT